MAARRRNFQGALHIFLAFDFGKIHFVIGRMREDFRDVHLQRRKLDFAFQKLRRFAEILHGNDVQALNHRRLGGVFGGNQNSAFPIGLRLQGHRQDALDRPHAAGQSEFAEDDKLVELVRRQLLARGQHPQRDRQIEARPFFLYIGGREVDGRLAHRKFVAGVGERRGNAVLGFLDRRVRQADQRDCCQQNTQHNFSLISWAFRVVCALPIWASWQSKHGQNCFLALWLGSASRCVCIIVDRGGKAFTPFQTSQPPFL